MVMNKENDEAHCHQILASMTRRTMTAATTTIIACLYLCLFFVDTSLIGANAFSSQLHVRHEHCWHCVGFIRGNYRLRQKKLLPFGTLSSRSGGRRSWRTKLQAGGKSKTPSALSQNMTHNLREEFLESRGLVPLVEGDNNDGKKQKNVDASPEWKNFAREWAVDTLQPILYPSLEPQNSSSTSAMSMSNAGDSANSNICSGGIQSKPLSVEKALKRTLRSLPSKTYLSQIECRWLRSRLAKLILGTSIMRRRYEYIWNVTTPTITTTSQTNNFEKLHRVREQVIAMIHYYEQEELLLSSPSSFTINDDIVWPLDAAQRLSVYYSLPNFLVEAWIEQYGKEQTEQICKVCNEPGPITFRRNALKCPSDKLLMERILKEEDLQLQPLPNVYLDAEIDDMDPCTDDNTSTSRNGMMLDGLDCREKGLWKPPRGCLRLPSAPHKRSIWSMGAWKDGWFEVQDMGSQIIVQATEAIWGETIVDYCAGNGGKTLALASKMHDHKFQKRNQDICKNIAISATANFSSNDDFGDSGSNHSIIFAHDISDERIRQLQGSFQRAGIASSSKHNDGNDQCDGHHYHQQNIKIVTTANAKEDLFEQMADVVLVDAPCSSSGVLRRRPSQRWDIDPTEVHHALPALQLEILQNASKLVKPGGRLVYATCSILKWENENVVKEFEQQQQVSDDPNDGDLWIRWNFHDDNNECHSSSKLSEQAMDNSISLPHCKYLLPHCHNSDGFFIARWKKGF